MIVDEKKKTRFKDLLSAAMEQADSINRIIIEAEPGFERSKLRALLHSKKWPMAVNPNMIIDTTSESDMLDRAESILEWMVGVNLHEKRFLDFGCGEGHVVKVASERADFAAGYDIADQNWDHFEAKSNFLLTDVFEAVMENGPYDVIMIYDVLDHVMDEEPKVLLRRLRSVLKDNGKVYVRCHPWCSKHGTHLYQTLNKAWAHFFFTPEELLDMGHHSLPTLKILHPISTYQEWFAKGGFKKIDESDSVIRDAVENFFEDDPLLNKLVKDHWKDSVEERLATGKVFPKFQLEQQFLDFVLVKDGK